MWTSHPWFVKRRAFFLKAVVATILIIAGWQYFKAHYRIGIATQAATCLPGWRVLLIALDDRQPHTDAVYAFRARGIETVFDGKTFFPDGTEFAKVVSAVPGDRIAVGEEITSVNGEPRARGLALHRTLGKPTTAFVRTMTVPPEHYFFLGLSYDSYDGRYWGFVHANQIIGRAYRLL